VLGRSVFQNYGSTGGGVLRVCDCVMEPDYQTHLLGEPEEAREAAKYRADSEDFNASLLDDGRRVIKLSPIGQRAINGVYSSYNPNFPAALEGIVPKQLYEKDMERFNHRMTDYWPCPFCFGFGYFCCLCTLGMSFYCPSMCVASAEKFAVEYFDQQANNRREYFDSQLKFRLVRQCCASWVEVSYNDPRDRGVPGTIAGVNGSAK
jgi:hypothetical protein